MAFSPEFETALATWIEMDREMLPGTHLDDSKTIDAFAQHYLDGAATLAKTAATTEEKAIAFQWRGLARTLEALGGLVGISEAT